MNNWTKRFKGLIQWFMQLEPQEHGHWCATNTDRSKCPFKGYRWDCAGLLCGHVERKNCPKCAEIARGAK